MRDSTRSLLFGVFVLAGRPLTAAQIIRLMRPLGVSATNAKSHLTRLVDEGALTRSGPVRARRYAPSRSQSTVVEGINARLQPESSEAWDGTWLALTVRLPAERGTRERLWAALWFDGFRPWAPGTFVRPAWPEEWAMIRAQHYLAHAQGFCMRGKFVDQLNLGKVSAMYGLNALDRQAHSLARWVGRQRLKAGAGEQAFAVRLKVGGLVARLASHDPRLPPRLWVGRTGMRELVRAFRRFETRIRPLAWKFLASVLAER